MKSENAQTPILRIGSSLLLGDDVVKVKAIKSYVGMGKQAIPYVVAEYDNGITVTIPHNQIEEALQLN